MQGAIPDPGPAQPPGVQGGGGGQRPGGDEGQEGRRPEGDAQRRRGRGTLAHGARLHHEDRPQARDLIEEGCAESGACCKKRSVSKRITE